MEVEGAAELVQGNKDSSEGPQNVDLELTIDEVVEDYVGALGIAQVAHVLLVSLAWMFDAQITLVTIFTDAQPKAWRCKTPATGGACTGDGSGPVCGLKPGTWEWVGGSASSVIAEWGLVCDRKFLAAIPASLFFIGSLVGNSPLPPLVSFDGTISFSDIFRILYEGDFMVQRLKFNSLYFADVIRSSRIADAALGRLY